MKLKLSKNLTLPLDAVSRTFGILAVRGAGKSNTAAVMAEEMFAARLPFCVIDPVGSWYGLRSSADGKAPGLPIPIFGGKHGDVPLERGAGELIADLIVEKRLTCVLDLSRFDSESAKKAFLLAFAQRLYQRNENPLHLFLEEADDYIPQKPMRDEAQLLRAWENIVRRGRARGLGMTIITQRSAAVAKMVLTQVETLFAMRTTGPQDIAAIEAWVKYHQADKDVLSTLASLADGEAWVWSPHYLKTMSRHQIRRRETFDSGATPKNVHVKDTRPPATLADIDLSALQERMAATIEKAKADDPRELRKQIVELRKELVAKVSIQPSKERVSEKRVDVLTDADRDLLKRIEESIRGVGSLIRDEFKERIDDFTGAMLAALDRQPAAFTRLIDAKGFQKILGKLAAVPSSTPTPPAKRPLNATPTPPARPTTPRPAVHAADPGDLSPAELRMLDVVAAYQPDGLARIELAIRSGYAHGGGGFKNTLSALNTAGLIDKRGGLVVLSADGERKYGPLVPARQTAEDVQAIWRSKLSPAEWKLLQVLIDAHPNGMTRADLAQRSDYEVNGGGFRNTLSAVNVNGLIEKRSGEVRASEVLCV